MKTKKLFIIVMTCIISVCCNNVNFVYADEGENDFNPNTMVTFGMIGQDGEMGLSPSIPFESSYFYGISHALYNYFYSEWHENTNFPDFETWSDRLYSFFPSGFFDGLASNDWLMNVSIDSNNRVRLYFSRNPDSQDLVDIVSETNIDGGMTLHFEPNDIFGGIMFAYNFDSTSGLYNVGMYSPYFALDFSDEQWNTVNSFTNNSINRLDFNVDSLGILSNLNIRFFMWEFQVNLPSMTIETNAYFGNKLVYGIHRDTLSPCICVDGLNRYSLAHFNEIIVSQFPIYYKTEMSFSVSATGSNALQIGFVPSTLGGFEYNSYFSSLPIISYFENIPQPATPTPTPTFTPIPIPSITLVPSATPIPPVTPVEGLGQMFTLFTRKYTFTLNGAEIGIRPLYLFLACFFVGMIFRVFQGGNSE